MQSPYTRTVFLDVDTTICASLKPAYDFLEQYDFAMAPEALDIKDMELLGRGGRIAAKRYFEMSSGVIYCRRSPAISASFRELQRLKMSGGQHSFHLFGTTNDLFGKSKELCTLQLPPEYNLRMRGGDAPRLLTGPVRVLHAKSHFFPRITCAALNREICFRLWSSSGGVVRVKEPPELKPSTG